MKIYFILKFLEVPLSLYPVSAVFMQHYKKAIAFICTL